MSAQNCYPLPHFFELLLSTYIVNMSRNVSVSLTFACESTADKFVASRFPQVSIFKKWRHSKTSAWPVVCVCGRGLVVL
jgi:hypothetical protein